MLLHVAGFPSFIRLISHFAYMPHFMYPFICWWTLCYLHALAMVNIDKMIMKVQITLPYPDFIST